jgi:hypothetical protein
MTNVSRSWTDRTRVPSAGRHYVKNNPTPGKIMLIAGGAVLFIATFLDWISVRGFSVSGTETDAFGFQGFWCLLIGAAVAVLVALQTFANINLPARVLGFSWNQIFIVFGVAAFLITFGLQFVDNAAIGITLGWIASAVIVAGAFMEMQSETRSTSSSMPSQF